MHSRALVKERAVRNLLLLIDGNKSEEMLLTHLAGISRDDLLALQSLGLIEPIGAPRPAQASAAVAPAARPASTPLDTVPMELNGTHAAPLDYAQFTAALTQIISRELGLRGFMLTLAVEKAGTIEELQDVARRALDMVRDRKGEAAAAASRRMLYGG